LIFAENYSERKRMKKKPILIVSIALTVFVLAFGGILAVSAARARENAQTVNNSQGQVSVEEYAALVQEANERILLASQGFEPVANESPDAIEDTSDESQPETELDPEEALGLALAAALDPQTLKGNPELVIFEGQLAYEILFGEGAIYINAATGEILMNGTTSLMPGNVSLERAVIIAQDYMDLEAIYQSDIVSFQGAEIYRVIFDAGHFVYVDKDGQIIYVQIYSPGNSSQTTSTGSSGDDGEMEYEEYEEYEEEDEHDDHDDD
jgi:hypothetical protein